MPSFKHVVVIVFVLAGFAIARAQDAKSTAEVLNQSVSSVESEFVSAAEAMPEDKYSFVPTDGEFKGVRTFAQQVKHVAAVNYILGAGILAEKPPVETGEESGPESLKTKAEILKYLKDSYAYAHKAVATINDANSITPTKSPFGEGNMTRLQMATIVIGHSFDHYGQIVVYLRMNGIIPPASRR
jgi:uncharacterized damage-inducible protein DinB